MNREETAGSMEMAFGVWGAVGPSSHVLDGVPDPPMIAATIVGPAAIPLTGGHALQP